MQVRDGKISATDGPLMETKEIVLHWEPVLSQAPRREIGSRLIPSYG